MNHLAVHSDFSFLKAYGSPEQIVARAKVLGSTAVGIADSGGCWGHIPFWKACKKEGIKPLFGVQLAVSTTLEGKESRFDLVTLIAKNDPGLKEQYNLVGLATEQFYYRPRLTWGQLRKIKNNFVIIDRIAQENIKYLSQLRNFHLAAVPEAGPLLNLVRRGEYPVVISLSPVYPEPNEAEAYRLVNAISSGRKTYDIPPSDRYMMREDEINAKFQELGIEREQLKSGWDEIQRIVDSVSAAPKIGKNVKPDILETLEEWCLRGAKERGIDLTAEPYKSRYEREVSLINQKGFTDYFLLIADIIRWAKQRMFVGPARGSSAGSLVCYLMGIVEINPLDFDLLFERFIDLNREDLPDVDIDFPDDQRDLVFDYIVGKYGADRVARLGTVSVFKPKSALNDVGKCYSIPSWEIKKLTEVMVERSGGDARANMAIEDTIEQFAVGRELLEQYPKLLMATKLEGHPRHTGQHAAGVIVADKEVDNYFAVNRRDGAYIGQINKYDAEAIGLLKIDALGLKTLAVIQDCCEQVGMDPRSLYRLPFDKAEAFKIFQDDNVAGIFQFEGYAVRSLMRQMGVHEFNDIVALTALARPGPLHCGAANEFIVRRTGEKDWDYEMQELRPHTSHTYGTIVYQEQVMSITRDLGDMSWQDVSALRKAMSKSLGEEFFNQYRDKFITGTRKKGIDDDAALKLWNEMCTFGSWAFNLSHAVSYATLSYWCAYLKARHPLEFAVAHLRRTFDQDHVLRLLRELMKEGIELIPFDPEISDINWKIHEGKIYGGFIAVKGVGPKTAEIYMRERNKGGDWISRLTQAQRQKILAPKNTPWHNLNRIEKTYKQYYDIPPGVFGCPSKTFPKGVKGPVVYIEDIVEKKGTYRFIGTIKQRNLRDLNETQSLAKRGGRIISHHTLFLNLVVEDDTSSILCTIDRWKYPELGAPLMEAEADGKDFLIRGEIKQDGWRKINVTGIRRLDNGATGASPGDTGRDQEAEATGGKAQGTLPIDTDDNSAGRAANSSVQ